MSTFDSADSNGTWRLYVEDEFCLAAAVPFADGWALEMQTECYVRMKQR